MEKAAERARQTKVLDAMAGKLQCTVQVLLS